MPDAPTDAQPEQQRVTIEEEKKARYELWRRYETFAPKCLKIQTMESTLEPLVLNEVQNVLQEIIYDIRKSKRLIRLVILKARREGVSTWTAGRFYWRTTSNSNRYAMMITHEPEASDFLFNMQKRFNTHLPAEIKPDERYNNKKIIEFNNAEGTGIDSAIRVGTAGKEDFGSGQLTHYLHCSEVSKWDKNIATPLLTSILQTVPDEPFTEIILESTAKGIGGEFADRYWKSRYQYEVYLDNGKVTFKCVINENAPKDNAYSSVFVPWFVFGKYTSPVPEDFIRTEDEEVLVTLYGLTDGQLQWRRWAIENKCNGIEDTFKQEYPSNAHEAFLVSGTPVFNAQKCMLLKKAAPKPIALYEVQLGLRQVIAAEKTGRLKVWKEPLPTSQYIIAGDVAEGLEHGDFSCADVIDWLTGEQVAQWHGKIDPDQFAIIMMVLGRRYNEALLAPERNNHGLIVLNRIVEDGYPRLFLQMAHEPPQKPRKRFGWLTNKATKPLIVDNLVGLLRDDLHGIKCAETFDEMLTFKQDEDGSFGAEVNKNDDRVMSIMIAHQVRKKMPLPTQRKFQQMNKLQYRIRRGPQTGQMPTGSWT